MTNEDQALREHKRETLNQIIDLLETLPTLAMKTNVILSAAAMLGVKVKEQATTAPRSGYSLSPKRKRGW